MLDRFEPIGRLLLAELHHRERASQACSTYVFEPLVFNRIEISLPTYRANCKLDVRAGSWTE